MHGKSVINGGGGDVVSKSLRYGFYGVSGKGDFYANLYLGGAEDFFDSSRNIEFPGISRTATSSTGGRELNVDSQVGYDLKKDAYTLTPFAGLAYDHLTVDPYTESGAGTLNLSVNTQQADSLRSTVGTKLACKIQSSARVWTPYLSLGWQHEYHNQSRAVDAQLNSGVGSAFSSQTAKVDRDATLVGAGLSTSLSSNIVAKLIYAGDLRSNFANHTLNAELRFKF
ncbi:MAG: autotransporter outer membrane beta-barrel domain-containing protein [Elusimicrobia bacterium]|nr:autotransporter outer membrane beta-barrel domain-containing protein [Elusimicrobiota bacterium]